MELELEVPQIDLGWVKHPAVLFGAGTLLGLAAYSIYSGWTERNAKLVEQRRELEYELLAAQRREADLVAELEQRIYSAAGVPEEAGSPQTTSMFDETELPRKKRKRKKKTSAYGIVVQDGRVRVDDWAKWMKFAPRMTELALDAGATTAPQVLKVMLNIALPSYPWPPSPNSRLWSQWERFAGVVARTMQLPNPPPDGDDQDARTYLRLVK